MLYNYQIIYNFRDNDDTKEEVSSLPNVYRFGINRLKEFLEPIIQLGLKSVLLFGVLCKLKKVNIFKNYLFQYSFQLIYYKIDKSSRFVVITQYR